MRSALAALALLAAAVLTACASTPPPPMAPSVAVEASQYRLGAGDRFKLSIVDEPTYSGAEYLVDGQGSVSLPLIGSVRLGGMTTREAEAALTARYRGGYINNAQLNIEIVNFRPFYILGEVGKPGEYPYTSGLTVMNAVARAEGFTYRADQRRVYIKHLNDPAQQVFSLTSETPVAPGDTITIGERFF